MNDKRPMNLDLGSLKFPPMAIASILHRVSGIVIFVLLPWILYLFNLSMRSRASYDAMTQMLHHPIATLALWAFGSALIYHLLAGIRHLLMDTGWGEGLNAGRRSAVTVMLLALILVIGLGVKLW